jgi:hypothetical protein
MTLRGLPDLWHCPHCGAAFTSRNQWHACGTFSLETLSDRSAPFVRELYEAFREEVEQCGPVTIVPQRSRVVFMVRMRFAALMPRKAGLRGHLVLAARHEAPCFDKIESLSRHNHLHLFRLTAPEQLDAVFQHWIGEAYQTGQQAHLQPGGATPGLLTHPLPD